MTNADVTLLTRPGPPVIYPKFNPNIGTAKLYRPANGLSGGFALTQCQLTPSDAPFTGGNLVIYNATTVPMRVGAACVAPTEIANNGYSPIQGGAAGTWTQLTQGQVGGYWIVPPATFDYACKFTSTLNVMPGLLVPGFVKIPFTVNSIPRTDITTAPHLLMFRIIGPDQFNANGVAPIQLTAQANAYSNRRPWNNFYKAGNFVSSNQSGLTSPTQSILSALSVEFNTTVPCSTVMELGDSTTQGAKTTDSSANLHDYNGPVMVACDALSTLTRPVYAVNCGFQGLTTQQIISYGEMWLNAISPKVLIVQPWSINDFSPNQSAADDSWFRLRAIMLKAYRSGITCLWRTAYPAITSTFQDGIRNTINTRCKTDPLFGCVDYDSAVTNGATPARIAATYDSGDQTHCNSTGVAQMAALLQTAINPYV